MSSHVRTAVLITTSKLLNSIAIVHNRRLPALILVNVDMRSFRDLSTLPTARSRLKPDHIALLRQVLRMPLTFFKEILRASL